MVEFPHFLWLNNSPFVYTPQLLYPFTHQWRFRLFLCLVYWKDWCCEHGSTDVFLSQCFCFLWMFPEIEFLEHKVSLFLIFWESSILFSMVAAPIYISLAMHKDSFFLHIHTNFCSPLSLWIAFLRDLRRYLPVVLSCRGNAIIALWDLVLHMVHSRWDVK